jgi:hypothetical protein
MSDLERFLNDDPEPTPPLIKAALAHVQFETITPFSTVMAALDACSSCCSSSPTVC